MLRTQFKMEMLVYAQDRTYSTSLSESKREEDEEEEILKTNHRKHKKSVWSSAHSADNQATLGELMLHLKSYYRVSFS